MTPEDRLLKPGEVASMFRVTTNTTRLWSDAGKLNSVRTPGGHRRFRESEVTALLNECPPPTPDQPGDVA